MSTRYVVATAAEHAHLPMMTRVLWCRPLEVFEDVFGARRRPQREQVVVLVGQRAAAADRDHARISHLREDHGLPHVSR